MSKCNDCSKCRKKDLNIPDILRNAENMAIERENLCKNSPKCGKCGTYQVQIIDVNNQKWKCRNCKHEFCTDWL